MRRGHDHTGPVSFVGAGRARPQARSLPRHRPVDDLPRPHPARRRGLADAAQLRLQRRRRVLRLHLRLSGRLDLRPDRRRRLVSRRDEAAVAACGRAVCRAHHAVSAVHRADRPHRAPLRQSDVPARVQRVQLPGASGRADRAGDRAEIQTGQSRRAAALHHAGARLALHRLVPGAPAQPDARRLGRALCAVALVQLERRFLPARHDLVLQTRSAGN
ncbi:hypothetical protein ABIA00_005694 [Bradyrhizobium ottawaense]